MRLRAPLALWLALSVLSGASGAFAQQAGGQAIPGVDSARQWHIERLGETHWKLTGDVEIDIEKDVTRLFADEVEIFTDRDLLLARGNVTLTTPTQRISADSLEFNTKTKLGTFRHASGSALLQQEHERPAEKSAFGTQEPEVLFYGETIEKIGEKRYRITDGGFTTCVQPKPRWEITSGTAVLDVGHYAMLQNSLMRVKGVPILYLPIIYYPINKEDRATGFLLPMYGTSTLKGHTFSNAFFWAMSRSQDATFNYDWFSKTGHGFGSEYRYVRSRSSSGDARVYMLNERATSVDNGSGQMQDVPGRRSFEARANLNQDLPFRLRGRLRLDYFSDITVQRTYNTNIYDASRRQRSFSGSVSGNWGPYGVSAWLDRSQFFFNADDSTVTGALPRVTVSRGEQPLGKWPVYFGVAGEVLLDGAADDHRGFHPGLGPAALRRHPDRALPVPEVPVLHGELLARLAVHLVERERRRAHGPAGAPGDQPPGTSISRPASSGRSSTGSSTRRTAGTPRKSSTPSSRG